MRPRLPAAVSTLVLLMGCNSCGETTLQETTPLLTPSSTTIDFGRVFVGANRAAELELQSTGTGTVRITRIHVDGDTGFTTEELGAQALEPRERMTVAITFSPTQEGDATAQLVVENDSVNSQPLVIMLRGTGAAALDCDDHNTCTDDTFDAQAGVCAHANNSAPCESGSLCTHDDRCVDGQCRGLATLCSDDNACTRDLCDPAVGCVFVPINCEDGNTCTADTCDPLNGCQHRALPDGAPCEDGNLCSTGDTCMAGECRGGRPVVNPAPVGVAFGYGSRGFALVLDDARVLFLDLLRDANGPFVRASVTERTGTGLRHLRSTTLDGLTEVSATEVLGNGLVAVTTTEGPYEYRVTLLSVGVDGTVQQTGQTETFGSSSGGTSLIGGGHLGSVRYLLASTGTTSSTVIAVDASDPANPEVHSQAIPAAAWGLAVDEVHQLLLLAASEGIVRLSVADPLAPAVHDVQLPGTLVSKVATNGIVTSVCTLANPPLMLVDADTGALRQSLPPPGFNQSPCEALRQVGAVLVATDGRSLFVYDVEAPQITSPAATAILPETRAVLSGGGSTDVLATLGEFVFVLERNPVALVPVSGPGHGRFEHLLNKDDTTIVASSDGAHQLDVSVPSAPTFSRGQHFPSTAALVSFSTQLRTPTVLTARSDGQSTGDPEVVSDLGGVLWMDASDLANPQPRATAHFLNTVGPPRSMRTDGRRIYRTNLAPDWETLFFDIINPDDGPGAGNVAFESAASIDIPLPPGFHLPPADFLATDDSAPHVVLSLPDHEHGRAQIVVVDIANPDALSLPLNSTVDHPVGGLAIAGSVIAAADMAAPDPHVHLYAWSANTPSVTTEVADIAVPGFSHFLLMDEHVVLVSTSTGVAYISLVTQPPALLGEVETPESRPLAALVQGQHLLLSFPGEVLVLSPPCPPPP